MRGVSLLGSPPKNRMNPSAIPASRKVKGLNKKEMNRKGMPTQEAIFGAKRIEMLFGKISPRINNKEVATRIETTPVTSSPQRSMKIVLKKLATRIEKQMLTNSFPKSAVAKTFRGFVNIERSFLSRFSLDFFKPAKRVRPKEKKTVSEPEKKAEKRRSKNEKKI